MAEPQISKPQATYDLLVIGGGINGTGIARDAAGRGLSVLLVEKDDLAAATSSSSSKLIHGGLRYLEQYEFRLVAEALREREVLLANAPHLVTPLEFIMPHVPELRPRWMIRLGLFLYDHLGSGALWRSNGRTLPRSEAVDLTERRYADGLRAGLVQGFRYFDCRVDDARLVVANAMAARELGAIVLTRTECTGGTREPGQWRISLRDSHGASRSITARAVVNAAGPWVKQVLNQKLNQPSNDQVRLVQGSHIVVPRAYAGDHAFILQNDDRRVVFMIPYEGAYTLIGTTDVACSAAPGHATASADEIRYLCAAANRYLSKFVQPEHVVWSFAGIRPLYDDGTPNPSQVTRDYTLRVDGSAAEAPLLSVFGGKITTYRKLAEHALDRLAPWFPTMTGAWTSHAPLPGGALAGGFERFVAHELRPEYPWLPKAEAFSLARRHGTYARRVLDTARSLSDLGRPLGAGLYAREVDYMIEHEWVVTGEDLLFRRTKLGLHMTGAQRGAVEEYVQARSESRAQRATA